MSSAGASPKTTAVMSATMVANAQTVALTPIDSARGIWMGDHA